MDKRILVIGLAVLAGCGNKTPPFPPFRELSAEQVQSLPAGDKACYRIALSVNAAFPDSPTHCAAIKADNSLTFKETYSFYLTTSTEKVSEWNTWACLAAGKFMSQGAEVGMEKLFFKSSPSKKYAAEIEARYCRDLQRKAYDKEITEFEVLKEFNRRSKPIEM